MKKIFYNGNFITMEKGENKFTALLIDNEIIASIGEFEDLQNFNPDATLVNLDGKTLMPSFIDSHSHFSGYAMSLLEVNLDGAKSFREITNKVNTFINDNVLNEEEWIVCSFYDHNTLEEKKHPTKSDLDVIAGGKYPIVIKHKSGHLGVFNSKALEILNINMENSSNILDIFKDNGELTGYMEEIAFISNVKKIPLPSFDKILHVFTVIQDVYASYGITTVQEGMLVKELVPIYKQFLNTKKLKIDLVAYVDANDADLIFKEMVQYRNSYVDNFKIGGLKTFLDGSPQGRTAFMLTPYRKSEVEFFGYPTISKDDLYKAVTYAYKNHQQILAHCNGDAACQMYIDSIKDVYCNNINAIIKRPVMVHAQFLNISQLDEVKKYNIIPSFFIAHTKYWGDIHIDNFGFERASLICPAKSAAEKGILFTFHQDSPVINADMLETVECSLTRVTKKGVVLGSKECIDINTALHAITINAAYQYSEEDMKGTLTVGKFADLVILNENPLDTPTRNISEIKILETIKNGKTIYRL